MAIHFEQLWLKCENFHKENLSNNSVAEITNELIMKIGLYSAIDQKTEIASEDMEKAKSRLMGEILLSLTALSLQDNINVYEALYLALSQRSISTFDSKYSE